MDVVPDDEAAASAAATVAGVAASILATAPSLPSLLPPYQHSYAYPALSGRFYENFLSLAARFVSLCLTERESELLATTLRSCRLRLPSAWLDCLSNSTSTSASGPETTTSTSTTLPGCGGRHCGSCTVNCTRGWLRSFFVAYSTKSVIGIGSGLLRGRRDPRRLPQMVRSQLVNRDSLRFALFLSCFLSSYRGLYCAFRRALQELGIGTRNPTRAWRYAAFAAGLLASQTILLDTNKSRRTVIALYALTRACEYLGKLAHKKMSQQQPEEGEKDDCVMVAAAEPQPPLRKASLPVVLAGRLTPLAIMMLSSAQILYSFILHPKAVSPSYYNFLLGQTGFVEQMGYAGAIARMRAMLVTLSVRLGLDAGGGASYLRPYPLCEEIHPGRGCARHFALTYAQCFRRAVKLYAPLNACVFLLYHGRLSRRYITRTLRSCVFLAGYVTTAWSALCVFRRATRGREARWLYAANGLASGLWCALEPASRRVELSMYCLQRALEAFWHVNVLPRFEALRRQRKLGGPHGARRRHQMLGLLAPLLTTRRVGEPVYFALSVGTLMAIYETSAHVISPTFVRVLERFFGSN